MKTIPQIIHHIPGRVRFRIHRLSYDRNFALRLKELLKAANGIKKVRLNDWAACVVIDYDLKKESKIEEYIVYFIDKAENNYSLITKNKQKKISRRMVKFNTS